MGDEEDMETHEIASSLYEVFSFVLITHCNFAALPQTTNIGLVDKVQSKTYHQYLVCYYLC